MKIGEPEFKTPPIRTTASGVRQVSPSDILRSEVGQKVIRDTASSSLSQGMTSRDGTVRKKQ
jgi:hypothetical protein